MQRATTTMDKKNVHPNPAVTDTLMFNPVEIIEEGKPSFETPTKGKLMPVNKVIEIYVTVSPSRNSITA